jgi:hypothetical protein
MRDSFTCPVTGHKDRLIKEVHKDKRGRINTECAYIIPRSWVAGIGSDGKVKYTPRQHFVLMLSQYSRMA